MVQWIFPPLNSPYIMVVRRYRRTSAGKCSPLVSFFFFFPHLSLCFREFFSRYNLSAIKKKEGKKKRRKGRRRGKEVLGLSVLQMPGWTPQRWGLSQRSRSIGPWHLSRPLR